MRKQTADTADMSGDTGWNMADEIKNGAASGYTSTRQAAKALEVSERTIRRQYERGELKGRIVQRGQAKKALEISIDSLGELRDRKDAQGLLRKEAAGAASKDEEVLGNREKAGSLQRAIEDLFEKSEERAVENGRLNERLQLTERAESTLREELSDLEDRAHRAESEAEDLRRELEDERSRGFWSRLFGG